jgi:hypothetical protein
MMLYIIGPITFQMIVIGLILEAYGVKYYGLKETNEAWRWQKAWTQMIGWSISPA